MFIVEVRCIHLPNTSNRLRDVVQNIFAVCRHGSWVEIIADTLFAAAQKSLDLVGLEVIVVAESPANSVLLKALSGRIYERIGQVQIVQVEGEGALARVVVIKDCLRRIRQVLASKALTGEVELAVLVHRILFIEIDHKLEELISNLVKCRHHVFTVGPTRANRLVNP